MQRIVQWEIHHQSNKLLRQNYSTLAYVTSSPLKRHPRPLLLTGLSHQRQRHITPTGRCRIIMNEERSRIQSLHAVTVVVISEK